MVAPEGASLELYLPPDLEPGVYADALNVWHSPYEFTLDFSVLRLGDEPPLYRIVGRIRISVTLMFDVVRALNDEMTEYERVFGEIERPRPRGPE